MLTKETSWLSWSLMAYRNMLNNKKTTIIKPSVKVGKYFMSLSIQHVKNERQFATMHVKGSIID